MQENQNHISTITDEELAKRYGTDNVAVEITEIDFGIEVRKVDLKIFGLFGLNVEGLTAQAKGRGLYLTIAVIGLATLISAIGQLIN